MATYTFGPFLLDCEARRLCRDGEPLALTGKTFDLLLLLVQRRGTLVNKEELLSTVWRNNIVEEANLTQSIFVLRKLLGDRPRDHRFIATVPGCGYQFVAQVAEVTETGRAISPQCDPIPVSSKPALHRRSLLWAGALVLCAAAALVVISSYTEPMRAPALKDVVQLTNDGKPKNELVTDGVRAFYASPTNDDLSHWRTYQISTKRGETQPSPFLAQDLSPFNISPDRAELLLGTSEARQSNDGWREPNQLWVQPLAGGPPSMLALRGQDASWSPDGSQMVYAAGRKIGIAGRDGASDHELAELPGVPSGLRWSPIGDKIRFTLHYGLALENSAIWELPLQGGAAHPLFPASTAHQGDGQWMPDGRYYTFSKIENGTSQLWALRERKSWSKNSTIRQLVQLTTGPMQYFLPTPTPDGKRLLFYGMLERTSVFNYQVRSRQFEPFLPGVSGAHLDFSRDGKWLTYSSYPEHALWRAASDGTERLQLSPPEMVAMLPVISPDGLKIAFVGRMPGQPFSILVVGRDGGALQKIVSSEPVGFAEPSWSPDNASLVLGTVSEKKALYRFDFAKRSLAMLPGSEGLWSPRWSRNGQFIAALGSPTPRLMLYDLKSRRATRLTSFAVDYPAWSHDGQSIYFESDTEENAWYRLRLHDRKLERLLSLAEAGALPAKPSRGIPVWINSWRGLAPDDSLLIAREAGSTEIYSAEWIEH